MIFLFLRFDGFSEAKVLHIPFMCNNLIVTFEIGEMLNIAFQHGFVLKVFVRLCSMTMSNFKTNFAIFAKQDFNHRVFNKFIVHYMNDHCILFYNSYFNEQIYYINRFKITSLFYTVIITRHNN